MRTEGIEPGLDPSQVDGLTDMDPETFRAAAHAVTDLMADYLAGVERFAVLPGIEPGSIRPRLPPNPPEGGEPLEAILEDYRSLVEPNATHWQHPGFMAYFATTASGAGILGEMLTAVIGQNAMLWRTSPIGTELEEVVVDWLRQALGLPDGFDGLITDTASTSSLIALAAAREAAGVSASAEGLAGRGLPSLRVYASSEAHSSIDKACMTLGLGRASLRKIKVDDELAMRPDVLASVIAADRAAGDIPIAVVVTIGTTSSTSIDPIGEIADVSEREGLWLHADSAYAGAAAIDPSLRGLFAGWERTDSIVVNPHKWLFAPLDASLLLTRRMSDMRAAFSLVPEYLRTLDRESPVRDYNEYTPQLGRRFRALKLWMMLRWFGLEGLRRRIRAHMELARGLASWIDAEPGFERLAAVPFSTVCFRYRPDGIPESEVDALNERLLDAVNRSGEVFLSHTRLRGAFTIRVAIGNLRTEECHVARAWALIREAAAALTGPRSAGTPPRT